MRFTGIDPLSHSPLFQASHIPIISSFPHDINYCYVTDDDVREFSLRISTPPLIPILHVFDDLTIASSEPRPKTFSVTFRIFKKLPRDLSVVLSLVGRDFRVDPPLVEMSSLQHDFWSATVAFSCTKSSPLLYKYAVAPLGHPSEVTEIESGNAHSLFVSAPIGGAHVTVYDSWQPLRVPFPYHGRSLQPLQAEPTTTAYRLEIVAPDLPPAIHATFSDSPRHAHPLLLDGAWTVARDLPVSAAPFNFEVASSGGSVPLPLAGNRVLPGPRSGVVVSRYAFAGAFRRALGVYAPLVSLRAADGAIAGDFGALVPFAAWAKACGLRQVHVHLEWLPGQQIDPVHAIVACAPRERTLRGLREAKVAALTEQYRAWKAGRGGRSKYRRFLANFPWLAAMGVTKFGRWVQWRLWQQLSDAYVQVVNLGGMQLMIDVIAEPVSDWPARLIAASRCAHVLRVVRLESVLFAPIDVQAAREVLPSETAADNFLSQFCIVGDGQVQLKNWIIDHGRVRAVLERFAPADGQVQSAALTRLMLRAMDGPMKLMNSTAGEAGAAFVLEGRMADWLKWLKKPKVVWDGFGMIPATNELDAPRPSVLMPRRVSPEQISEFPEEVTPTEIHERIRERADSSAEAVTVYLGDLLVAEAGLPRAPPESLEGIEGCCRFVVPLTIAELPADQEITSRVQALVKSSNRDF
jgi:hypothetical protein